MPAARLATVQPMDGFRVTRGGSAASLVLALVGISSVALAEPTLPLDRFEPAPPGDRLLVTPDPGVAGRLAPAVGAQLVYAEEPLRIADGSGVDEGVSLVDYQLTLHVAGSLALRDRLLIDFDLPAVVAQDGDSAGRLPAAERAALGDVRVGVRAALLRQAGARPGAAAALTAWLPTGNEEDYAGSTAGRYSLAVAVGGVHGPWTWGSSLAARYQQTPAAYDRARDSDLLATAGLAWSAGWLSIGPEAFGSTIVTYDDGWFRDPSTHLEALGVARARHRGFEITVAGGPGFGVGIGTPTYRLVFGVGYAPPGSREAAGELVAASAPGSAAPAVQAAPAAAPPLAPVGSAAVAVPESPAAVPPPASTRVAGTAPAAPPPAAPSAAAAPPRRQDGDGDGIFDADDRCPGAAGPASGDLARHGCPRDADGDGILDLDDACPRERGVAAPNPEAHGCPTSVRIVGSAVVISARIAFETGSDRLAPESSEGLSEVAALLQAHPEIVRLAADGHTDDVGLEATNLALSRRRAIAVVRWLVDHGVDERRLVARGFGPRRPLIDEPTAEARSQNRRVEFQILERSERGEAAWRAGDEE